MGNKDKTKLVNYIINYYQGNKSENKNKDKLTSDNYIYWWSKTDEEIIKFIEGLPIIKVILLNQSKLIKLLHMLLIF